MARRNLEAAIQASHELALEGKLLPTTIPKSYSKVDLYKTIPSEEDIDGIYSLQFSLDGSLLAVGTGNEAMRLYETASGKHIVDLRRPRYGGFPVTSLKFHPQNHDTIFASTCEGIVYALDTVQHTCKSVITEVKNQINCSDFSEDGFTFATSGKDLALRVYDSRTCKLISTYEGYKQSRPQEQDTSGHGMRVFALKYHPDNSHILITGGWDNHLKIWDLRSSDGVKRTIGGPHICGDALDIKGFQILTGSWVAHNALQIWDYTSGKLIKNVSFPDNGQGEYLYTAQYCGANDTVIAGGSGTNSIKAINTTTGNVLGEIQLDDKCVQALDSTRGGQLIAVGGQLPSFKISVMS